MIIWLDAQLSPSLASWLTVTFGVEALAVRDVGLRDAKDRDYLFLQDILGPPPQVIWITCGNTSNAYLREICEITFPIALKLLDQGEPIVEIGDAK